MEANICVSAACGRRAAVASSAVAWDCCCCCCCVAAVRLRLAATAAAAAPGSALSHTSTGMSAISNASSTELALMSDSTFFCALTVYCGRFRRRSMPAGPTSWLDGCKMAQLGIAWQRQWKLLAECSFGKHLVPVERNENPKACCPLFLRNGNSCGRWLRASRCGCWY